MPLYIKDSLLVSFAVSSIDGKCDKDNFLFVVSVDGQHQSQSLNIFVLGKQNGHVKRVERKYFLGKLMKPDEIEALYKKMNSWFKQI